MPTRTWRRGTSFAVRLPRPDNEATRTQPEEFGSSSRVLDSWLEEPKLKRVQKTRRTFVKGMLIGTTATVSGTSLWLATSKRRAARLARTLIADARRPILAAPAKPQPAKWSDNDISLAWIGHSTVLINFFGFKILTDPAFGNRVGVSLGVGTAGPKRYIAPALKLKELPPIDLVLLSHAHMDHMDLPTLSHLGRNTPFVSAAITSDVLDGANAKRVTELRWDESTKIASAHGRGDLQVTALEVKHWGQRWPKEIERGYNGYVLTREGKSILFAGDTAQTELFKEHRRYGPFEAAIMPIGAYDPWIWNHCSPEQAVSMADAAGAKYMVPVHHQTFKLSNERMKEPIERVENALSKETGRLALRQVGETFVFPKA